MSNKIHENTKMNLFTSPTGIRGTISLEHLAKPESVVVYLNDCLIIPESFDILGQPIISEEMALFFSWKYQEKMLSSGEKFSNEVPAVVVYEPEEFNIPKDEFDSVAGISRSLHKMEEFTEMLNNRKRYLKVNKKRFTTLSEYVNSTQLLGEYVIWKRFIVDKFANIHRIENDINIPFIPDVCELDFFDFRMNGCSYAYTTAFIPEPDSVCPICGRKFSTYDMQTRTIASISGKYCHNTCKEEFLLQQKKACKMFDCTLLYKEKNC